jgi:hypothetical protein
MMKKGEQHGRRDTDIGDAVSLNGLTEMVWFESGHDDDWHAAAQAVEYNHDQAWGIPSVNDSSRKYCSLPKT